MLEPIRRRAFDEPDRVAVQEAVARAVESGPERFFDHYRHLEQSLSGRYVSADLFKETFEPYSASRSSRHRYNTCVHNAAAVLASEYLRRLIRSPGDPERDTVILLTGIPGAGKTSSVLAAGELPANIRAVYEGQLSNPETALAKVQQVLEGGCRAVIVAVHATPEQALGNTLRRFAELGRGAGIGVMASIQGELPDSLQRVRERFADAVTLQIVDRRQFHDPELLDGWKHLGVLRSEGTYEHIKHRLTTALERLHSAGHLGDDAYDQALSRAPRSAHAGLDSAARGRDENHGHERSRAPENRQETLLTPPAATMAPERQGQERWLAMRAEQSTQEPGTIQEQQRQGREAWLKLRQEREAAQEHTSEPAHGLEQERAADQGAKQPEERELDRDLGDEIEP
jgi:hypothetical protein